MSPTRRNPGPSWGYRFLILADRHVPGAVFRPGLRIGSWVAMALMPKELRCSREYLRALHGREPRHAEIWRHFHAITTSLVRKLVAGEGRLPPFSLADKELGGRFETLARGPRQALFGTFHLGDSDLMGCLLTRLDRPVTMLRMRVENSRDVEELGKRFAGALDIVWVNDPSSLLFELKRLLQEGRSLALQCDRVGHASKLASFRFLGARREFPVTIYHLAALFRLPVVFAFAEPLADGAVSVHSSPVFDPPEGLPKAAFLDAAHHHFQEVLAQVETLLRRRPELWFNFIPLNPVSSP